MSRITAWTPVALLALAFPLSAQAQGGGPRLTVELRAGANVPTFDIADAAKTGPSFGGGLDLKVASRFHVLAEGDFGFHDGVAGPNVNVFHLMGKVGVDLLDDTGPWIVMVNAGAGALHFAIDGGPSYTYPAINVGAKLGYRLTDRFAAIVSPQGDIAFSKKSELGTTNSWVWPFAAGLRIEF